MKIDTIFGTYSCSFSPTETCFERRVINNFVTEEVRREERQCFLLPPEKECILPFFIPNSTTTTTCLIFLCFKEKNKLFSADYSQSILAAYCSIRAKYMLNFFLRWFWNLMYKIYYNYPHGHFLQYLNCKQQQHTANLIRYKRYIPLL